MTKLRLKYQCANSPKVSYDVSFVLKAIDLNHWFSSSVYDPALNAADTNVQAPLLTYSIRNLWDRIQVSVLNSR